MDEKEKKLFGLALAKKDDFQMKQVLARAKATRKDKEDLITMVVEAGSPRAMELLVLADILDIDTVKGLLPNLRSYSDAGDTCMMKLLDFVGDLADKKLLQTLLENAASGVSLTFVMYLAQKVKGDQGLLNKALFAAVRNRRPATVRMLVEACGADVDAKDEETGSTPLIDAAIGARMWTDLKAKDLGMAAGSLDGEKKFSIDRYAEILSFLMGAGADVRAKNKKGMAALDFLPDNPEGKLKEATEEMTSKVTEQQRKPEKNIKR